MSQNTLFKWFGLGAIPKKIRPVLVEEGIVLSDEGIFGRLIKRHVSQPGMRCSYRSEGFCGSLVITKKRIACFTFHKRQMSIGVDDPKLSELFIHTPKKNTLSISFESSTFHDTWSGVFEFRFKTENSEEFKDLLLSLGAQHGTPIEADQIHRAG
ncbi:MAG: hypothetical protein OEL75_03390 [Kiritimatiellaceae bacterium]|nr:hypothetical protein [Kiritimatiellaceae bacterium]